MRPSTTHVATSSGNRPGWRSPSVPVCRCRRHAQAASQPIERVPTLRRRLPNRRPRQLRRQRPSMPLRERGSTTGSTRSKTAWNQGPAHSGSSTTRSNGYLPEGTATTVLGFWHRLPNCTQSATTSWRLLPEPKIRRSPTTTSTTSSTTAWPRRTSGYRGDLPALTKLDADYVTGAGYVPEHLRNCVPTNDDIANGLVFRDLGIGDLQYEDAWAKFQAAR